MLVLLGDRPEGQYQRIALMLTIIVSIIAALSIAWLSFIVVLLVARPDDARLTDAVRIVPDVVRLVSRLARDRTLPRGLRFRLWLLVAYLASPIDLVPDFLPVIGYADDVIVISVVLRSVVRRAGGAALERHWPGTPTGLSTLKTLCQISTNPENLPGQPPKGRDASPGTNSGR